jgi:hypothetical protein
VARLIAVCLCVSLCCAAVRADDAAAPALAEPGDTLVQRAVAAYAQGDLVRARALFEEAHFTAPTARTLRGLGVLAYRERRFVDAVSLLEASLDAAEKPLTAELRASVQRLLEGSRAQVARVSLALAPEDAEVTHEGAPVPRTRDGALVLAPGAVALRVAAAGHATRELSLQLAPGEQRAFALVLPVLREAAAAVPAATNAEPKLTPRAAVPSARGRRLRRWAYGLAAASGAALVSTAITAGLGAARVNDANARCRDSPDGKCSREEQQQLAEDHKLALLAALTNVGAVAAGVSGSASITLWVLAHRAESTDQPRAAAVGVRLGTTF